MDINQCKYHYVPYIGEMLRKEWTWFIVALTIFSLIVTGIRFIKLDGLIYEQFMYVGVGMYVLDQSCASPLKHHG